MDPSSWTSCSHIHQVQPARSPVRRDGRQAKPHCAHQPAKQAGERQEFRLTLCPTADSRYVACQGSIFSFFRAVDLRSGVFWTWVGRVLVETSGDVCHRRCFPPAATEHLVLQHKSKPSNSRTPLCLMATTNIGIPRKSKSNPKRVPHAVHVD
jgi:hypothetical protein